MKHAFFLFLPLLFFLGCSENTKRVTENAYNDYLWQLFHVDSDFSTKYMIDAYADVNVVPAWNITKGAGIKVAVIDEAFDVTHEDLKDNILLTYNVETNGSDVNGSNPHGTACAGVIAAIDNTIGIVGVAPKAQLVLIATPIDNNYSDAKAILAFDKAIQEKVDVISCSWGTYWVTDTLASKIQEAYDAGIVVVFAAGNEHRDLDDFFNRDESELPTVIGVGASDELNDIAYYSDHGSNLELIAPAGNKPDRIGVLTLDPMGTKGKTNQKEYVNNSYNFGDGTSYAAPLVAGTVALILSVAPDFNMTQVRDILISTTQKVGLNAGAVYTNGFDLNRSYGKLDAGEAVMKAFYTK